ncbi:MAG TPA: cell division protein ZipA C-terminal FtsZ-binding domain-containing protein, partial [Zeimonas sp.]
HGPLNAMEFSEFVSAVQAIAESLSARAEMPAMGPVLARARDLDSTCAQLDVQIGVNVEAPEAVEPAQLAVLAPALSLVERGSHRYVRPGPQGEPLFSLGFSDSPSRLTFLLDVPRVPASLEPFARMVQAAGACAQRLDARLVDDSGKSLTQASLAQIARQLEQRYESLEAIGLPAGSTLACKVFN